MEGLSPFLPIMRNQPFSHYARKSIWRPAARAGIKSSVSWNRSTALEDRHLRFLHLTIRASAKCIKRQLWHFDLQSHDNVQLPFVRLMASVGFCCKLMSSDSMSPFLSSSNAFLRPSSLPRASHSALFRDEQDRHLDAAFLSSPIATHRTGLPACRYVSRGA